MQEPLVAMQINLDLDIDSEKLNLEKIFSMFSKSVIYGHIFAILGPLWARQWQDNFKFL